MLRLPSLLSLFFFFNDTATTEIYTLSLHDALPILSTSARFTSVWRARCISAVVSTRCVTAPVGTGRSSSWWGDRKSTRLNSSHGYISYAVFCLKKKKYRIGKSKFESVTYKGKQKTH